MPAIWPAFREAYLTADRRTLGLFRILFGCVLLYDLVRRARFASLFYSNDGVLSNHFALFAPQASPQVSLYFTCSTPGEIKAAFALTGLIFALYVVGLFTRAAQILSFVCYVSLNNRNLFFEDGGVCLTILLLAWTAFLPLGDRFSLDALRRMASARSIRERVELRRLAREPVVSLAFLALLLQAAAIYYFNAVHKSGPTWRNGDAVHLVLWQHRINTDLAVWLAHHEPRWFSPVTTFLTLRIEYLQPALLLMPLYRAQFRSAAFVLSVMLHGGIALIMSLGAFSYSMVCMMLALVPGTALDVVRGKLPDRWGRRLQRLTAHASRAVAHSGLAVPPRAPGPEHWTRGVRRVREGVVGLLIVVAIVQASHDNPVFEHKLPRPELFRLIAMYPRMQQFWAMFSKDAPTGDGTLVVDAVTVDGRHVDPFTGEPPDYESFLRSAIPLPVIVTDYFHALRAPGNKAYRRGLTRYLKSWHRVEGRPENDRLVSFEAIWVSWDSPPRGSTEPSNVQREVLMRGAL